MTLWGMVWFSLTLIQRNNDYDNLRLYLDIVVANRTSNISWYSISFSRNA